MLELFTHFATWLTYDLMGLSPETRLGISVHFFIEDTTKILFLLVVMIYLIALARASLNLEQVRAYIQQRHRFVGYVSASGFGAITPFCSCSSIPLFLGFTSAGIPLGITMAFLFTSPIINEVAVIMLWSLLGWIFVILLANFVLVGWVINALGALLFAGF